MAYQSLRHRLKGPVNETLKGELGTKNIHALPSIEKVVVSTGINKIKMDSKEMHEYIDECLAKVTGQKPVHRKAKKAIANFKTREGMIIGSMVTLRGQRAEEFLDKLLSYALPRTRDFRGLSPKLDGHGNYAIGIQDISIFPEVPPPDASKIFGVQVQLKTTAKTDEEGLALLKAMGFPFRKERAEESPNSKFQIPKESQIPNTKSEKEESDSVDSDAKKSDTPPEK